MKELIEIAKQARLFAYAPYSKFKVGAALLCKSGKIYTGCNVENSSLGATICAERVAVCKAIGEGEKDFIALAIVADTKKPCSPCGICRQFINEFAPNLKIIMANTKGKTSKSTSKKLLPHAFSKKDL